jgi:serine/threonine-protein kinase RsbW
VESSASGDTVRLTVPAAFEFVRLVRLTTSGVASRLGFDVEDIEDLRVAVDELASIVVEHAAGPDLDVVFTVQDGTLRIDGRAPAGVARGVSVDDLTSQILAAVVDEYEITVQDSYVRFCCARRLPAT